VPKTSKGSNTRQKLEENNIGLKFTYYTSCKFGFGLAKRGYIIFTTGGCWFKSTQISRKKLFTSLL